MRWAMEQTFHGPYNMGVMPRKHTKELGGATALEYFRRGIQKRLDARSSSFEHSLFYKNPLGTFVVNKILTTYYTPNVLKARNKIG